MKDARTIVEGALTTAIFIILFLICMYIPLIAIVGLFFLPLPLMYYTSRHGVKSGSIAFFASLLLTLLFTQFVAALSAFVFLLIGLVMGYMVNKQKSAFAILAAGSIATILCLVGYYGAMITIMKINPITEIINQMTELSKMAERVSPNTTNTQLQWQNYRDMLKMLPIFAPLILTMGGISMAFICELISAPILRRFGINFPKWPLFRDWAFPKSLIWYYLLAIILLTFGGLGKNSSLYMVSLNVFQILDLVMVLQGITFIFFYFHFKGKSIAIPVILSIIGAIMPFNIMSLLGIIDLGFGLRARIIKQ